MGSSNEKEFHTKDTTIRNAINLQSFFAQYYDSPDKLELLQYIPIAINYHVRDLIAEDSSFTTTFYKPRAPLRVQMQYRFCDGCYIIISQDYNRKLRLFAKSHKTNDMIVAEYYQTKI